MTLTHESLRPLVGKKVTVTRNDIPGSWTGILFKREDDTLELSTRGGFEVIPFARVVAVYRGDHCELSNIVLVNPLDLEGACGDTSPVGVCDSPTPSRYQWSYKGASFDFYRLCEILGVAHHAQAHALKKVIRAGRSVKGLEQDIDEAIAALKRWKEMVLEDRGL